MPGIFHALSTMQVSDVVLLSPTHDVGARNERHLVAVYSNKESGFEVVHGMLNKVMEALGVPYKGESELKCGINPRHPLSDIDLYLPFQCRWLNT